MQKASGIIALVTAVALPVAALAQSFQAVNRLQVIPMNASDFEVIEARGEGARGLWCAAADFTLARYGNSRKQRIYVKSPRRLSINAPGRKGVVFTIDANRLGTPPIQSLSVTVRTVGVGLPVNHAIQFCRDNLIEPEDLFFRLRRN